MTRPLYQTVKGPLILLFYDGFERRARAGLFRSTHSQMRRLGRYLYRTARRKQVRTGFYTAFIALRSALERHGCDVRVNDFATAASMPDYPIGLAGYPSVLEAVDLPNPAIFGPGDFGSPRVSVAVAAQSNIKFLIQPSDWFTEYYRPFCGNKVVTWFAGIDTNEWADASGRTKSIDVLIYDKIRWHREARVDAIIRRLIDHLESHGLSYSILRYGEHYRGQFAAALKTARSMSFICEHETQGLAYQEALAANVPVFAWDEGEFVDPQLNGDAEPGLAVSSVPYFDHRCGKRFKLVDLEVEFDRFWAQRDEFAPRQYVLETLSMELSAAAYLALYLKAATS